jgi:hypothetical protein
MNYKNLFMLFSVGILSTLLLADNPGDDAVNDEPVAVETAEESVEQVVAEEETSSEAMRLKTKRAQLF